MNAVTSTPVCVCVSGNELAVKKALCFNYFVGIAAGFYNTIFWKETWYRGIKFWAP